MVDKDTHMGDKIMNKHKENIINIKKVATFGWKKAADWDKTLG